MTAPRAAALICLLCFAPLPAVGQSSDAASERARLGNQRIQAEAERRMREERELQSRTSDRTGEPTSAQPQPIGSPAAAGSDEPIRPEPPPSRPESAEPESGSPLRGPVADDEPTTRALHQLRELGELKDAGYVTDEEFRRIKERILERQF